MADTLKIGFLGVGSWATICMNSIRQIAGLKLIACYARTESARLEFAQAHDCQAVASEEELFSLPGLDAVCIMTPNFTHHAQVLRAAEHGLHIFVEKPMANTVAECREMVDAAKRAGVVLFTGHNSRRELRFRRMKAMLEGGELGRLVMAEINYTSDAALGKQLGGWRYNAEQTPAVALSQIGIHAIDILHYVLGTTREVQAWISNVGADEGIEDVCLARMLMPDNVSAMFLNAYSVPRIRSLSLMGTGGSVFSDSEKIIQYQKSGTTNRAIIEVEQNNTVLDEFDEFLRCCRGEATPETDGEAGLAAIAVMQGMLHSSRNAGVLTKINGAA